MIARERIYFTGNREIFKRLTVRLLFTFENKSPMALADERFWQDVNYFS